MLNNSVSRLDDLAEARFSGIRQSDPWKDGDSIGHKAKPAEYMINKVLETGAHGILGAQSQAFKSFLAIKMAHSICTGHDLFGHKVFTTGKVLYICGEGLGALQRRIKATQIVFGEFAGNLLIWRADIAIDNQDSMSALKNNIIRLKPALVIFDTFSSLIQGDINENDNGEVARVLRLVREACTVGNTSSLIVHHFGKDDNKGFRGASAFFNNTDFGFAMKRNNDSMDAELTCVKMKDGELFSPVYITARAVELGFDNQDGTKSTSLVMEDADPTKRLKTKIGKKKKLSVIEKAVLTALDKAITEHGVSPNAELKANYGGLFASIEGEKRKVVSIKNWRTLAYRDIPNDSETSGKKTEALRKAFSRSCKTLSNEHYVQIDGDFAWRFYD